MSDLRIVHDPWFWSGGEALAFRLDQQPIGHFTMTAEQACNLMSHLGVDILSIEAGVEHEQTTLDGDSISYYRKKRRMITYEDGEKSWVSV